HTAVAVTPDGRIVTGHPGEPRLLVLDADGRILAEAATEAVEVHGITLHGDAVWIADVGRKRRPHDNYPNPTGLVRGGVLKVGLDGRTLARLDPPPLAVYETTSYSPTGTALD